MAKINKRLNQQAPEKRFFILKKLWRFINLGCVTLLIVSVVGAVGFYGVQIIDRVMSHPIASVAVEGDFTFIDEHQQAKLVDGIVGSSFVGEDIERIQQELKSDPWVDSVELFRQWPNTLTVKIVEQIPIARWGEYGFVNVRGELVLTEKTEKLSDYSKLYGDAKDASVIMQQYSLLVDIFRSYDLSISSLEKNRRDVWLLHLNNGWEIVLGRGDVLKRVQRLALLLDNNILSAAQGIAVIDVRYANGISVQWLPSEEPQQYTQEKG